jgi:hypothetical protein
MHLEGPGGYSPPPAQPRAESYVHTARYGETTATVARDAGIDPADLQAANPRLGTDLDAAIPHGTELNIPAAAQSVLDGDPPGSDFNPTYPSSNSEYTVGGEGDQHGGSITWNPGDGTVKGTYQRIETLPGQDGRTQVEFSARQETALTLGQANKDGNTEFTVEVQFTSSVRAEASSRTSRGTVEGEVETGAGTRARYKVVLPGENQTPEAAARVNPFDPTTIPVGATVTLDGQNFAQTELAGSFRHIGFETNVTEATGASYSVTRVDADNVQVTMGPNEAVEAFNGFGLSSEIATAMLGRQDNLGFSSVNTATFDLSNADGQAAYAHFVGTGEVAHQTPGVRDVAQIGRLDYSSQTRAQLELGPLSADLAGAQNTGSRVDITYPDGSYTSVIQLQYSGNAPLQVTQRFDADGTEIVSERTYQFTIDTDRPSYNWWQRNIEGRSESGEENNLAELLNDTFTGSHDSGLVAPGAKVTIELTEAQMQTLQAQSRQVAAADENLGGRDSLDLAAEEGSTLDFSVAIARNLGFSEPFGLVDQLWSISGNGDQPIDASVSTG